MRLRLMAAACAAALPTLATADTIEIFVDLDVIQDTLVTATGDPSYRDPTTGEAIFFPEYIRVLTEEASLFDTSVIPATPEASSSAPIVIPGALDMTVGVDLDDIDTTALVGSAFDTVGSTSLGFAVSGTVPARPIYEYFGDPIDILAFDDFDNEGTLRDVLFFDVLDATRPDGSTETIFFGFAFNSGYFQSLGGADVDFTAADFAFLNVENNINSFLGDPLYEERVEGDGTDIRVAAYDGVVGRGPVVAPTPVPLPAGFPLMLAGLAAFGLAARRAKA